MLMPNVIELVPDPTAGQVHEQRPANMTIKQNEISNLKYDTREAKNNMSISPLEASNPKLT